MPKGSEEGLGLIADEDLINSRPAAGLEVPHLETRDHVDRAKPSGFGGNSNRILDDHHEPWVEEARFEKDYGDMRVRGLLPYTLANLPVWFDVFTELAAANSEVMDWLIFCEICTGIMDYRKK